jgi:hypothetical protein
MNIGVGPLAEVTNLTMETRKHGVFLIFLGASVVQKEKEASRSFIYARDLLFYWRCFSLY